MYWYCAPRGDHSFLLPISPADEHYALVAPILSDGAICQTFNSWWPGVHGCWNTLPEEITTSQMLSTFRQQLKTWLFRKSYPDIITWTFLILQTINLEVALLGNLWLIDWLIVVVNCVCIECRRWNRMAGKCSGFQLVTSYQCLTSADVALLTCAHRQMPVH